MKAKLVFDLPAEDNEHQDALNGSRYKSAIDDLDNWLRGMIKYGHEFESGDQALLACRHQLHQILSDE